MPRQFRKRHYGAVHKVRHAILGQFFTYPLLCHFVTHPGTPQKVRHTSRTPHTDFLVGLVHKIRTNAPVQILSIVRGVLSGRVCLWSGKFCPGGFLSIPPSVKIHLLQQKVKHHFKFHV